MKSQALSTSLAGSPGGPPDGCKDLFLTLAEPSEERQRSWQMSPNAGMNCLTLQKIPEHREPVSLHEVAPIGLGTHRCSSAKCL